MDRRVIFRVEGLSGPPLGVGCCAVSRTDMVLDELDSWPGLLPIEVDPDKGTATVLVQPGCPHLDDAAEALTSRGMPTTILADQLSD